MLARLGEATFNLATMYMRGEGVRKSWSGALELFRPGERQGSSDGSLVLGELQLIRKGEEHKKVRAAMSHFAIALLHGDRRGARSIADAIAQCPAITPSDIARSLSKVVSFGVDRSWKPPKPKRSASKKRR